MEMFLGTILKIHRQNTIFILYENNVILNTCYVLIKSDVFVKKS